MTHWNENRFRLQRFTELGMAIRQHHPERARHTLLWIHGLGESGLEFERLICDPRLADLRHVVPDMIGYGKSAWPERPFGLEQHAASLDLLLDRLGIERAVLVGHSMGGPIGLYLADRTRSRIAGFFDIEGNISAADCTGSRRASEYSLDSWLAEGFDQFLGSLYAPTREPTAETEERAAVLRAYGASAHLCDPRTFHRNSLDLVRESDAETLAPRLAELDLAQIYVHGSPRGTGPRSLELLHQVGIRTHALSPAGHWPHLDRHDDTVSLLLDFLDALPADPDAGEIRPTRDPR